MTTWILTQSAVAAVLADPTATGVVDVAGNTVFQINTSPGVADPFAHATYIPTVSFKAYEQIVSAVEAGPIGYQAILYDAENWSYTPAYEQSDALRWYPEAGRLIHDYGYLAVASPARDLANVPAPPTSGTDDTVTISSGLLAACAPWFDVVDIQAQYDQPTAAASYALPPSTFEAFVGPAVSQIRAASPTVAILCGLRVVSADVPPFTNMQSMQTACADYAVAQGCQGFWMNFNSNNTGGVAAVQALSGISGASISGGSSGVTSGAYTANYAGSY